MASKLVPLDEIDSPSGRNLLAEAVGLAALCPPYDYTATISTQNRDADTS